MMKKLFILLVVAALIAVATIPMWTTSIAENAFKNPKLSDSPAMVNKAIELKTYFYMFEDAREIAEKAILYFPESEYGPEYVFAAAFCSEKASNYDAAIHWYQYFIDWYPKHHKAQTAQNNLTKIKEIHKN